MTLTQRHDRKTAPNAFGQVGPLLGQFGPSNHKVLKTRIFCSGRRFTPFNAQKSIVHNALDGVCSVLRQVCLKIREVHLRTDPRGAWLRPLADGGEASFSLAFASGAHAPDQVKALLRPLARGVAASLALAVLALPASGDGWSSSASSWSSGSSFEARPALSRDAQPGSSFHGLEVKSSFDPAPRSQPQTGKRRTPFVMPAGNDELEKVRAVIFHAESRQHGYDAYNLSGRFPPPKPASTMTLREIQQWIRDTPGQQHAIGRYQIIPSTLNRLIARTGLDLDTVFSPGIQDSMANILIIDAGYLALKDGSMNLDTFMIELAKVWAGFPLASGRSYYQGDGLNRATLSYANYSRYMAQIFPAEAARRLQAAKVAANP